MYTKLHNTQHGMMEPYHLLLMVLASSMFSYIQSVLQTTNKYHTRMNGGNDLVNGVKRMIKSSDFIKTTPLLTR